jgi:hypothetical protein
MEKMTLCKEKEMCLKFIMFNGFDKNEKFSLLGYLSKH